MVALHQLHPVTRSIHSFILPRYILAAGATVTFILITVHLLAPPTWPTLPQLKIPAILHTSSRPSAWLSDTGFLRYTPEQAYTTEYDLLLPDAAGYECDAEVALDTGHTVCRNTVKAVNGVLANVGAQQRVLAAKDAGPDEMEHMESELADSFSGLEGLAGKRILVVGDSVDRTWITQLVDITSPSSFYTNIDLYSTPENGIPLLLEPTHTKRAIAMKDNCGVAVIPLASSSSHAESHDSLSQSFAAHYTPTSRRSPDQLRIDFAFVFGILNKGNAISERRHINTTERMTNLTRLLGGDLSDRYDGGYDAISVNFGLWDLSGFQRENYMNTFADDPPALSLEWIAEYTAACERFITALRDTYGHRVPMYMRLTHNTGTGGFVSGLLGLPEDVEAKLVHKPGAFKPLRLAQMRQAQMGVAKRMGMQLQKFATRFEGQTPGYLSDTVHPTLSASVVHMEMVFRQWMGL